MSYSRWMCSEFYTFWSSSKVYSKGDEIFSCLISLDTQHDLTYHDIKQLLTNPKKIQELEGVDNKASARELESYMLRFVDDVDNEYEKKQKHLTNQNFLPESRLAS